MKRLSALVITLLLCLVSVASLPNANSPEPPRNWATLELGNLYGFRGEQINLTAHSNTDVNVLVYNPSMSLIYNQTWAGNESRLLPIQQNAPLGLYTFNGVIENSTSITWFNVVDSQNFAPTSFPFLRVHNHAEYWVFSNRSFRVNYRGKTFGFTLPDLPTGVSINCFNNSDIFTARFTSAVVNIDMSLVFVHAGAKLVINGSMQNGFDSFRFNFFSPQQINRWASRLNFRSPSIIGSDPAPLFFDWQDFVRAGEHLSYNSETGVLTVFDVPQTFRLDPVIGNNVIEASEEGYENYDEGNRHQVVAGAGNITNFSIYCRVSSGSDDIGVALYDDDATSSPDNLLWNDSRTISHTTARWENFTVSPQVTVSNGSYIHLMHNKEAAVIVYQNGTEGEADPNSHYDNRVYSMPFPDPFSDFHNEHAYMFSIYCDYTLAVGETTINQYSTVNQTSSLNSVGSTWLFSRFSGITSVANISSFSSWAFSVFGSAALSFAIASFVEAGVFVNFYGTISQVAAVSTFGSWSFSLFSAISQIFSITGWTDLTPAEEYATTGFVLAAAIMALLVVGVPLTLVVARR